MTRPIIRGRLAGRSAGSESGSFFGHTQQVDVHCSVPHYGQHPGTYYPHGDHLGSLNVLTETGGAEVQRLTYLPFRETLLNSGAVDFLKLRFTGQEENPETGLYYYGARYYNPALGRFISPDSLVPHPGDPQSLNRYNYVRNNPVKLVTGRNTGPGRFFVVKGNFSSRVIPQSRVVEGNWDPDDCEDTDAGTGVQVRRGPRSWTD